MSGDGHRLDEAIAWHVRLNAGDADEAAWLAFTAWLEAAPANRAAYDCVEDVDAAIGPEMAPIPNVIAIRRPVHASRRGWIAAGALIAASIVIAIGVSMRTSESSGSRYATAIGETRIVTLADGSAVTLNTDSQIDAAVTGTSRRVALVRGEALFHVAKDAAHPFIVTAGDRTVRVVGTIFDVLRDKGTITVIVAEGRVAVSRHGAAEIHLVPGQRITAREGTPGELVDGVNAAQALAWRQGFLIYENAPLSSVVTDLNRYFVLPVSLADSSVAAQRFSGALRIDDENAMLDRIAQFLPVRMERTKRGIVLHRMRKPG